MNTLDLAAAAAFLGLHEIERPLIDAFLADIIAVCERHQLSISHEDRHGSFIIEDFDPGLGRWLFNASDATDPGLNRPDETRTFKGGNSDDAERT